MSTKIYYAYRAPISEINALIDWAHDTSYGGVLFFVNELTVALKDDQIGEAPEHLAHDEQAVKLWRKVKAVRLVLEECKKAAESKYKEPFDIDCGFNLWVHAEFCYIIPIGPEPFKERLDTKRPDWVEDFAYYNACDAPEGIEQREWDARGKVWDQICKCYR